MGFKQTKQVIVPVFPLEIDVPRIVTITAAAYLGEKVEKDKDPATLIPVVDPATKESGLLVANEVLKSTLEKSYPNASYVGKTFEITKLPKREGKAYNGFRLNEGEYTPDPLESAAQESSAPEVSTAPVAASPVAADAGKTSPAAPAKKK